MDGGQAWAEGVEADAAFVAIEIKQPGATGPDSVSSGNPPLVGWNARWSPC